MGLTILPRTSAMYYFNVRHACAVVAPMSLGSVRIYLNASHGRKESSMTWKCLCYLNAGLLQWMPSTDLPMSALLQFCVCLALMFACIRLGLLGCYNREPRLNSEHIGGNLHSTVASGNAAINLRIFTHCALWIAHFQTPSHPAFCCWVRLPHSDCIFTVFRHILLALQGVLQVDSC